VVDAARRASGELFKDVPCRVRVRRAPRVGSLFVGRPGPHGARERRLIACTAPREALQMHSPFCLQSQTRLMCI
jgi:hypothetical protein